MQEVVPIPTTHGTPQYTRMADALGAKDSSVRLQAALAVGSNPDPGFLETLVERCAVEPDFFVRDMLSWALTRLSPEITLPRVRRELDSERAQARSQALHTLSKIGDPSAWAWITRDMLRDADDEVARTAWRVAVLLVPEGERKDLADELLLQLGRGDRSVQLSLSRALVDLGDAAGPALENAVAHPSPEVAAHARATLLLRQNPEAGFDAAVDEARRVVNLGPERAAAAAAQAEKPAATAEPAGAGELAEATVTAHAAKAAQAGETIEPAGATAATVTAHAAKAEEIAKAAQAEETAGC
ncbi:HEAT repeat domain-containing protein [Streptomyces sp. NPDC051310]|uniref:HEAT repeat domain-containing protein n=1 Tax=Streptomyces sp. NPDC051310 TaxID=3365649 RepID=UPI00379C841A